MREYGVSLRHPNKRFQIKQADREERVFEYLKNIWTVRKFFLDNFGVDPPVINGDQIPLHRNESSSQKTLNFTGMDTYVKENYNLSRKQVTLFTQVSSDPDLTLKPEFVFKGKGTRTSLHPPDGIKYNWAPKGSYRLEQMLYTISNLPNRYNIFTPIKLRDLRLGRLQGSYNARNKGSITTERICTGHYWWWGDRRHSNQ